MKIWILGANGQIGKALSEHCKANHIFFHSSIKEEIDITDLEKLKRACSQIKPTHLINCAAYTDVDGAEKNHSQAFAVNARGPENLAYVAIENGLQLVHLSTDYVFDGEKGAAYVETDSPSPLGIYGKSKWEGELRIVDRLPSSCIVRTSWVFGNGGKNFISGLLSKFKTQEYLKAVEDQINRATYSGDLAKALIALCNQSGIFHFANSPPLSRYQIAKDFLKEAVMRNLQINCKKVIPISSKSFPALSPRPKSSVLETEKVARVLGIKPSLWETVIIEYFNDVASKI